MCTYTELAPDKLRRQFAIYAVKFLFIYGLVSKFLYMMAEDNANVKVSINNF